MKSDILEALARLQASIQITQDTNKRVQKDLNFLKLTLKSDPETAHLYDQAGKALERVFFSDDLEFGLDAIEYLTEELDEQDTDT